MSRSKLMRALLALGLTAAVAVGVQAVVVGPASAAAGGCSSGHFCGFENSNYGNKIIDSQAAAGSNAVDVADDRISSGSNVTGNRWIGITKRTGLPDQTVFTFSPNTDISYVGNNANDKIDHFDVRTP